MWMAEAMPLMRYDGHLCVSDRLLLAEDTTNRENNMTKMTHKHIKSTTPESLAVRMRRHLWEFFEEHWGIIALLGVVALLLGTFSGAFLGAYDRASTISEVSEKHFGWLDRWSSDNQATSTPTPEYATSTLVESVDLRPGKYFGRSNGNKDDIVCNKDCTIKINNQSSEIGEISVERIDSGKKIVRRINPMAFISLYFCFPGEYYIVCSDCRDARLRVLILDGVVCATGTPPPLFPTLVISPRAIHPPKSPIRPVPTVQAHFTPPPPDPTEEPTPPPPDPTEEPKTPIC